MALWCSGLLSKAGDTSHGSFDSPDCICSAACGFPYSLLDPIAILGDLVFHVPNIRVLGYIWHTPTCSAVRFLLTCSLCFLLTYTIHQEAHSTTSQVIQCVSYGRPLRSRRFAL